MARRLRQYVTTLNLFDSETDDVQIIHIERVSTWVYLLLLVVTLSVFTIYTASSTDITVNQVPVSSLADYEELANASLRHLQCPCTRISVPYKHFISVNTTFHQVCSSDFVAKPWIDFLFDDNAWFGYSRSDLRIRGGAYFTALSSLCNLSQSVISNAIDQLLNESLINSYMISEADFRSKTKMILDGFIQRTPLSFATALGLINSVTHGNAFASTYFLNWDWETPSSESVQQIMARPAVLDNRCSCATRSDCRESGGVFYYDQNITLFTMPGFWVGCSSMDTLFGSTLECFYSNDCLSSTISAMTFIVGSSGEVDVHALDVSRTTRFPSNASLKDIIESLMVEDWQTSMSYAAFYDQCAPTYCTHVVEIRDSVLTVVTQVLGLYGGLVSILRLIVPFFIGHVLKMRHRRRTMAVIVIN